MVIITMAILLSLHVSGCNKISATNTTSLSSDTIAQGVVETEESLPLVSDTLYEMNTVDDKTSLQLETDTDESNTDDLLESTENTTIPVFSSPYTFYDVFREQHEMEINSAVPVNIYNPECYQYVDTDAAGNKIAASTDADACNTKTVNDPTVQMQGYTGIIKYEDEKYTSRFGIDVSKFQGNINWDKVKEAGVEFVFVRVGFRGYGESGSLKEDAYYKRNIEGARNAGIDVGVYFYAQAINEEEAIEEADYVLNLISGYNLELPVVYDPEHVLNDTARTDNVTGEQFTKNVKAFSDRISLAGYKPMVYANMMWEAYELDLSYFPDVPVWYADYENRPQSPYNFTTWQYSQAGKIQGIDGVVDLNLMIVEK